jgi:hypothetical protein
MIQISDNEIAELKTGYKEAMRIEIDVLDRVFSENSDNLIDIIKILENMNLYTFGHGALLSYEIHNSVNGAKNDKS